MCKCENIKKIWNKTEKNEEDCKFLSAAVPEQFEHFSKYYDENDIRVFVLKCIDCGQLIEVHVI